MEENVQTVDAYRDQLQLVLDSKAEEFQLLGYDRVTVEELWECLKSKKWKRLKEEIFLHRLVNDVLTLSTHDYMTYLTKQAYKQPLWPLDEYKDM